MFIVSDDGDNVIAMYELHELAERHAKWVGGWVTELNASSSLPPDVEDPVEIARRAEAFRKYQAEREDSQKRAEQDRERARRVTISDFKKPCLCHCCTFSSNDGLRTPNGHCMYCGGFTPEVILAELGNNYLQEQIDKLAFHLRVRLREILAGTRKPGL